MLMKSVILRVLFRYLSLVLELILPCVTLKKKRKTLGQRPRKRDIDREI